MIKIKFKKKKRENEWETGKVEERPGKSMSYQERFEQQVVNSVRSLRKAKIEILVQTI